MPSESPVRPRGRTSVTAMQELTDDSGTGDAQVDEAVRTLDTLDALPVHEHAAVFERVHQVLQDRLAGEPDADDAEDAGGQGFPAGAKSDEWGAVDAGPDGGEG